MKPFLEVKDLNVRIDGKLLLKDISFSVGEGQKIGFIGGSGSGKTLTALAVSGLLPAAAEVSGSAKLAGQELIGMPEKQLADLRGDLIGMVFQEPKAALNPLKKLGQQMTESLNNHYSLTKKQRAREALKMAARVGLEDAARIVDSYPHEVSGGQRQRAAIAAAISADPKLLFADEPTTALDVTVQKGVIELFNRLATEEKSLVFISHDLAVLSQVANKIYVFHDGEIIESGTVEDILHAPKKEITKSLIAAARTDSVDRLLRHNKGGLNDPRTNDEGVSE